MKCDICGKTVDAKKESIWAKGKTDLCENCLEKLLDVPRRRVEVA